jgi:hypothetical protein
MEIRIDRRLLYAGVGLLAVMLALAGGMWIGGSFSPAPAGQVANPTAPAVAPPGQVQVPPAAQQPPAQQPAADPLGTELPADVQAAVPRTALETGYGKLGQPNVLFVDTRSAQEYQAGHIQGALSMPLDEVPVRYAELPQGQEIIFYCA